VQKVVDPDWLSEIADIYDAYTIYHQSGGTEQAIFEGPEGQALRRSDRIIRRLGAFTPLPATGRLLDVGCGNGPFLAAFNEYAPGWRLAGSDLDARCREAVERNPGVETLFEGPVGRVPGSFDLISMIHVLEHVPGPRETLEQIRTKLRPGGRLLVEVPNLLENPFDLVVADHASHFTPGSVAGLIASAGFGLETVATDWVYKELTLVAKPTGSPLVECEGRAGDPVGLVTAIVDWLDTVIGSATECARGDRFGLFGTSIAACWLASELGGVVRFFVDEDPRRVGRTFMGRPVYHPADVPGGAHVFTPLPGALAETVRRRLGRTGVRYVLPPRIEASASPLSAAAR
jgi:SAM-dependent methyltransferase